MRKIILLGLLAFFSVLITSCFNKNNLDKNLMLHLKFDEGEGTKVKDHSNNLSDGYLQYVYTTPEFLDDPQDPQWRNEGIDGGSLLFDGYSNYIRYNYDNIKLEGNELTLSVWIAPRYFESNSGANTAIIAQYNTHSNEGVFLGYRDHGELVFQVGIGDRNLSITETENRLEKYVWNNIVAVFDGTNGKMSLFLNGSLVNEISFFEGASIEKAFEEPLYISRNPEGNSNGTASLNMVTGLIDELKIYNKALKEKDIKETYDKIEVPKIDFESIWLQNILTDDYYKPQFHGGPYQHWMNEPHAPMYYKGVYHLFFQFNMFGPYFANISWGHLVSTDMVNWTPLKEIITPTKGTVAPDGVWSGGSTYDSKGNPVLLFTAGNYSSGLLSTQNVGIARPKDLNDPYLTEWVVDDELAIIQTIGQGKPGEFRDAHVIKEDDTWYLTIGSGSNVTNGGAALIYKTKDDSFKNWEYMGELYNLKDQRGDLGSVWELPVLLPVSNEDKSINKYALLISPAPADRADNDIYYFLGDFDKVKGRFIPDDDFKLNPHLLDYGNNVFTGPSGFVDPVSGKSFVFSIMQGQRKPDDVAKSGWDHNVGLAREIYLTSDGKDLGIRPVESLDNYKEELLNKNNLTMIEANELLTNVKGDMLHIKVTFNNVSASQFGIKVRKNDTLMEETTIYYDVNTNEVGVKTGLSGVLKNYQNITGTFKGYLDLVNNKLELNIYLDRSLLEVFANERKAISARIFPDNRSLSIEVFADYGDVLIDSIEVSKMKSIFK